MKEQDKSIAVSRHQTDKLAYRTNGQSHELEATGDIAKGFAVAASAVLGFLIGFLSVSRS